MKQKVNNILITFLATIVFFVGTGVNVFNLCCANCADNLVSHVNGLCNEADFSSMQTMTCCNEQETSTDADNCASHHQKNDQHCSVERVSKDIQNTQVNTPIIAPFVWSLLLSGTTVADLADANLNTFEQSYKTPIPIPPREYLSLIRILII